MDYQAALWYARHTIVQLVRAHPQLRVYMVESMSYLAMICSPGRPSHISRREHTKVTYIIAAFLFSKTEVCKGWDPMSNGAHLMPLYSQCPWLVGEGDASLFNKTWPPCIHQHHARPHYLMPRRAPPPNATLATRFTSCITALLACIALLCYGSFYRRGRRHPPYLESHSHTLVLQPRLRPLLPRRLCIAAAAATKRLLHCTPALCQCGAP